MSTANWIKDINGWQADTKTPLSIHTHKPRTSACHGKAHAKRYYFHFDFNQVYLTQRELDVALLLLRGLTYNNIGKILGITGRTIECYATHLRVKFDCRSKKTLIARLNEINIAQLCGVTAGEPQ